MAHSQKARTNSGPNISRSLLLAFAIVGGMALTGADEVLTASPFIALNEALGFGLGFMAAVGFWAALGLMTLILVDWVWPAVKPMWTKVFPQLQEVLTKYQWHFIGTVVFVVVIVIVIFATNIIGFVWGHLVFLGLLFAVVAGVFVLLIAYEWLRERIESFVEFVPNIAMRRVRIIAKLIAGLAVLVYLGPVLSRPFLIPLGVTSKGWSYALTFVAAPVFTGFWYPFYTLGVWEAIQRILF